MKIKILLLITLNISLSNAMDRVETIDTYTIKSILSIHEREVLPQVNTLKEAFSLAQATINSEIEFWGDIKEQMLEENQRLKTIVAIIGKNKLSLETRFTLFTYQRKNTDTDEEYTRHTESREFDSYMYNAYKNLDLITDNIIKLQKIITTAEKKEISGTEIPLEFQKIKSYLSTEFAKLIKECELRRSLFTTSAIKSFSKALQANKSNNSSLDLDVAIRDISAIILPAFEGPKNILTVTSPKNSINSKKPRSKKRKGAKLKKRLEESNKTLEESARASINAPIDKLESIGASENNFIVESTSEQISEVIPLITNPISKETESKLIDNPITALHIEEDIPIEASAPVTTEAQIEISCLYHHRPYQKVNESKIIPSVEKAGPYLCFDQKVTIKTILGLGKEYAQFSVPMSDFVNVIETLNGHVLRNKKNVHFIIPSWKGDGKWFSKAMHPLHKDDKGNIPRNTKYYWDRAKNLLLEADVEALL